MTIDFKQAHPTNYRSGRATPISWIVLHYTANNGDTAKNNADYFAGAGRRASAHYFVDENSVWQSVLDSDTAWHSGSETGVYYNAARNSNSIGIEMCSDVVNGKMVITEPTVARAVELTRFLMRKYNVPIARVCRHFDVTHKVCPEPWVRVPAAWEDFKKRLVDDVTEKQVQEMIKQAAPKVYARLEDIPEWGRPTVEKLVKKGFIEGDSVGTLNISYDLLRVLVVNDRAHLYG